ncbi:MAG: cytochrome c3 family protein [Planctomycetota bacterium]
MKKGLIITAVCSWLVLSAVASDGQKKIGDVSDGSLAVPVHVIGLRDSEGDKISPDDDPIQPFSTRQTCSACHSYETIGKGRHFNAADVNAVAGRKGQPWIFVDPGTCTQIPLSYRPWAGAFHPAQLGMTTFKFTQLFGRHMPGGGVGELESDVPDELVRQDVSGMLENNCLGCHNAHPGQDQAEYAGQVARQNFRWAAAAACEFASVKGAAVTQPDTYDPFMDEAIATTYRENTFDHEKKVSLNITRKVPNQRCYFCHSNIEVGEHGLEEWEADEDVHLAAGLTCVDCHRNGLDHNIIRGYEGEETASQNPLAASTSCKGCHSHKKGRLGAPVPEHLGIPPVHFEKLTCTACHSGPWAKKQTHRGKTSRAHKLGTHGVNKSADALPHILYPVFARQAGDKIAPHKLIWPAFWASLKDEKVTPVDLNLAKRALGRSIARAKPRSLGDWPSLTDEHITKALSSLKKTVEDEPVYICGGKLYSLDESGKLRAPQEHPAAQPYLWPIAHNVRPAAQSLGVHYCTDCHATDAPFFFGEVAVDSPLAAEQDTAKKMVEFQGIDAFYARAFAFSFVFRPWLKIVALGSCALIGVVLLLYGLKALTCVVKALSQGN